MPANLTLAKYFALFFAAINAPTPWNSPVARSDAEIALRGREQKPDNPFCKPAGCSAEHEILGEYELPYKTHKARLVIAASKDPRHKCPVCGAALSFLEFTVNRQLWRVTHADFAVTEWGESGEPFDRGIAAGALGDDVPCVFVARFSREENGVGTTIEVYARMADGFHLVASIPTVRTTDIVVDTNPARFRDLIVRTGGTDAGNEFGKTVRYRFNGSKYELTPATSTPVPVPAIVRWDSVGARHQVLTSLKAQAQRQDDPICRIQASSYPGQDPAPGYKCSLQHQVLGEFDLPYKVHRTKLAIAGSWDPGHNCDGCGVSLSFFEFTLGESMWQLTHSAFGVGEWGQDGKPNRLPITVDTLGDDVPCVYADRGGIHQGISQTTTDIYARLDDDFRAVGSIDTSYDDSAGTAWTAGISLDPHPARLHDLIVNTSGTEGGKKFRKTERYHFNGKEYVLAP